MYSIVLDLNLQNFDDVYSNNYIHIKSTLRKSIKPTFLSPMRMLRFEYYNSIAVDIFLVIFHYKSAKPEQLG